MDDMTLSAVRRSFSDSELPWPTFLETLAVDLRDQGAWHASSRGDSSLSPYALSDHVREFEAAEHPGDYAVLAHDGHGANSWAIHCYLVHGPVGIFIQSAWGGAATSDVDEAANVARMKVRFDDASALLERAQGAILADQRLLVVDSDFAGGRWCILGTDDATAQSSREPLRDAMANVTA